MRAEVKSGSDRGAELKKIMDAGDLVSDELILDIIKQRIQEDDCQNGYLFDGFPRTVAQAEGMLANSINVDFVVELQVADEEIVSRMSGRRVHLDSGRTYHIKFNPPKVDGKDDVTGEALIQRDDDKEETVKKRLQVYHSQTSPLIKFYTNLQEKHGQNAPIYISFDGSKDVTSLSNDIISRLKQSN